MLKSLKNVFKLLKDNSFIKAFTEALWPHDDKKEIAENTKKIAELLEKNLTK